MIRDLTTTHIGLYIPSFLEEFGPDKTFDVVGSLSMKAVKSLIKEEVKTGFLIDKNGNFKLHLNFYVEVLVESKIKEG